ncbi:MAG TPA: glycosyltransferase family 2 protein, partial [Candidatus Baltobacteraceae bacterium]|nr:glycosyltransferase family 2 protein [Candidatus Baltobacteraceae bacterium]
DTCRTQDFQIVTGACLVTARALYEKLGGLDEGYWNGFEDVDYCLKVGRAGLRVVYNADAVLYHFESQSGIQRFRKSAWNTQLLEERWRGTMRYDALAKNLQRQLIRHPTRRSTSGLNSMIVATPKSNVVVHGAEPPEGRAAFEASIRRTAAPIDRVFWAFGLDGFDTAREAMRVRGLRYTAFVHGNTRLREHWLDELLRQITTTPTTVAATYSPNLPVGENVGTLAADARCTLVNLFAVPQHLVLEEFDTLDGSLADLLLRLLPSGFGTRGAGDVIADVPELIRDRTFEQKHGLELENLANADPRAVEPFFEPRASRTGALVSIVTLSWNAPQFTRMALDSIAAHTREPYEVIVVDNDSGTETIEMLRALDDPHVRIIYNATNRGFGGGNNDGIAAARGEFIVVLNNDVIVTDGWLDALLEPFDRIASVGVTAPRSNKIVGDQEVIDAQYDDMDGMHVYARERRARYAKRGFLTDRAIGFCLCIDRTVIDQIGGFDERFKMGNFEDDDFSIRVRAAGYEIYVCDDSFIHHFGSQSFIANNVNYASTMQENWSKFSQKWGYAPAYPANGYDPRFAIVKGFDRERHYAPLPAAAQRTDSEPSPIQSEREIVFAAPVVGEQAWSETAEFVRRYVQAFEGRTDVALMIGTNGEPSAETIGRRIFRLLKKLAVSPEQTPDVDISDEDDLAAWRSSIEGRLVLDVERIEDRSPSALRRMVEGLRA